MRFQARRKSAQICFADAKSSDGKVRVRREPSGRSIWTRQPAKFCGVEDPGSNKVGSGGKVKKAVCGL